MRLIDGDALFRAMEEAEWYNNADRDEIAEKLVLNAPTIEKRKTGKWIPCKASIHPYGNDVKCSECGHKIGSSFGYKFCPWCGAMMEGKQNGT